MFKEELSHKRELYGFPLELDDFNTLYRMLLDDTQGFSGLELTLIEKVSLKNCLKSAIKEYEGTDNYMVNKILREARGIFWWREYGLHPEISEEFADDPTLRAHLKILQEQMHLP